MISSFQNRIIGHHPLFRRDELGLSEQRLLLSEELEQREHLEGGEHPREKEQENMTQQQEAVTPVEDQQSPSNTASSASSPTPSPQPPAPPAPPSDETGIMQTLSRPVTSQPPSSHHIAVPIPSLPPPIAEPASHLFRIKDPTYLYVPQSAATFCHNELCEFMSTFRGK